MAGIIQFCVVLGCAPTPLLARRVDQQAVSQLCLIIRRAPRVWIGVRGGLGQFLDFVVHFLCFLLYGSWEALDSSKILPRGTPTISTPGEAIPRLFEKSIFWRPNRQFFCFCFIDEFDLVLYLDSDSS